MRNLKKVLALVLAFSMMFSVVAFANYADVDVDADYAGAVELLSALGILQGDDLGNFNPDNTITRAEYAAVVCRALGLENAANGAKGATQFTDVPADHWASGYINLATQNGIINGYGDGTFGPEDKVTYEQAVKMLVCALGFEPMAATKGGYPTGYLVIANQYKITAGVKATAEAPRSTVAQLVYNALSTPKMDQTSFGTDEKYEVLDGKNDRDYATLLTDMDIYVATGVVGERDGDEIAFTLTESSDDYEFGTSSDKKSDGFANTKDDYTFKINGSDIEKYQNQNVDVYVEKVSGKYYVLAIVGSDLGETFELLSDDIKKATTDSKGVISVEYYDENNKTKTIKVAKDAKIQENRKTAVTATDSALTGFNDDVELVFIENTGDTKYDVVMATEYASAVVDSVNVDKDKLVTDKATLTFDFDDEDVTILFEDVNGNAIELGDFAEDDVIAVVSDSAGSNFKNYQKYIRIINLGDNTVTGTVEATGTKNGKATVTIDGTVYYDTYGLNIDDEGTFYIGMTGKIIDFDGSAASKNYGFILEYAKSTGSFNDGYEVKLLTEKDGVVTYTFTDSAETAFKTFKKNNFGDQDKVLFADFAADKTEARFITFKTNAKGEIKSFDKATSVSGTKLASVNGSYNSSTQALDKKNLEDDIIIFNIDKTKVDDVYSTDIEYLVDDAEYKGYAFADEDGEYTVAIITEAGTQFSDEVGFAIVTDFSDKRDADGQDIREITYVQDEEEGTVIFSDEDSTKVVGDDYDTMDVGSVFVFNANSNGVVTDYMVIGNINSKGLLDVNKTALDEFSDDNEFYFGYIANTKASTSGKGERIDVKFNFAKDAEQLLVKSTSSKYTYDDTNSRNIQIVAGDFMDGDADYYEDSATVATFVFIRVVDGSVMDIYSMGTQAAIANGFYVNNDDPAASVAAAAATVVEPVVVEDVVVVEDAVIPENVID